MTKPERRPITIDDGEGHRLHASWSRSGKHLIVTAARTANWSEYQQVELRPDQVEELIRFLTETLGSDPADR